MRFSRKALWDASGSGAEAPHSRAARNTLSKHFQWFFSWSEWLRTMNEHYLLNLLINKVIHFISSSNEAIYNESNLRALVSASGFVLNHTQKSGFLYRHSIRGLRLKQHRFQRSEVEQVFLFHLLSRD